ncbi:MULTISPECIES: hypothetical protein [Saccharopolyspora]|uniref:Uncharacterized protein n=1 Tax=Saccharopolyspora gregorii TaxID=33914 RepID=A0ABP6RYE7_9PSEU|nr:MULTISPECIES: hypothetical protein [Saccharopolyspora]MCA1188532.1 hypothetical protein [Saccharopolyspora sp. 6T]MCA1193278.1 hypothetical protein [Saccharopolyspora sp. 6V]MCA1225893.1 hypothetical protein [Saccharopolyspora sp. 6M]MCA1279695.1 hypothetical protein [Saccharopolyspora sp. 7B]
MSRTRTLDTPGNSTGTAPEFLVRPEMLDLVSPPGDRGGMIIGAGPTGEPLTASILRPEPTRMVTVGGLYLARQIALRAMAAGAWVHVVTGRPGAWRVLERAAGLTPDGKPVPVVSLRKLAPYDVPRVTEESPLLLIHDGGAVPQEMFPPRVPWQTTMYVLPYLHPQAGSGAATNTADLILLQRLPLQQAQLAARFWYFGQQQIQHLTQLKDDGVIALGDNLWEPITLVTGAKEREILGPIRRGD